MFEGLETRLGLRLVNTRAFSNGNVVHWYAPS
jgi:hypothetical protein